MNIDEMSDQEKSNLLFLVMGWKSYRVEGGYVINTVKGQDISAEAKRYGVMEEQVRPNPMPNLYDPSVMDLVFRVLNWAYKQFPGHGINPITKMYQGFHEAVFLPADKVIEVWLDETIFILIEAGIIPPAIAPLAISI